MGTIVVYEKDDISQNEIVVMQENCMVLRFIEKPNSMEAVSHLVNTGIYVLDKSALDYIPLEQKLDFGKDVFPEMLNKKEIIYGFLEKNNLIAIDTPQLLSNTNHEL